MFYKKELKTIKENLKNYIIAEETKKKALLFFAEFLAKQRQETVINNRLKTKLEESKKYTQEVTNWKDEKEIKSFSCYNLYIEKNDYSITTKFYFSQKAFDNQENSEYFYFTNNEPRTISKLSEQLKKRIERTSEAIDKVKNDYKKINSIYSKYNALREKLDETENAMSYITLDQLNGQKYTIKNYN